MEYMNSCLEWKTFLILFLATMVWGNSFRRVFSIADPKMFVLIKVFNISDISAED